MLKIFLLNLFYFTSLAMGDICPPPQTKTDPKLNASVEFDRKTNMYTYSYVIENGEKALIPILFVRLVIDIGPQEIIAPINLFAVFENEPPGSNLPKHLLMSTGVDRLKPRSKTGIYSFKTARSPGLVKYYVDGDTDAPTSTPIPGNPEPVPNCPGFFFDRPFMEGLANGITTGPAPLNQISVEFKLKKMKDKKQNVQKDKKENQEEEDEDFTETTPQKDSGKIVAVLKSKKDFDVTTINISSIRLGTGQAPVETSEIKGAKNHEELRLVFDIAKLGIECDRDRVLFLTGKTTDGKDILGAEPIKTKNCDQPQAKKKGKDKD
ncbi:MAG: hypothetical protein WC635_14395 [Bacteriovorax sp.]|jgi:hypothetical protein